MTLWKRLFGRNKAQGKAEHLPSEKEIRAVAEARVGVAYARSVTPLHDAAREGNEALVRSLLSEVDPNVQDLGGLTPLTLAVARGHASVVALLPACS